MNQAGKIAVVTGGSRGIGRAIALKLAAAGANIVFAYAGSEEKARETVALVEALGVECRAFQCDVSREGDVEALFAFVMEQYGRVDILVNNAGITKDGLILRMSPEDFDKVMAVNTRGTFLCMKAAGKIMLKQKSGRIISISSVVALRGNAGQVNYAASKAAIIGMTKALAKELAPRGITVNAIAPGFIATDMTAALGEKAAEALIAAIPLKKLGAVEDVAALAGFLASDEARYITGQVIAVDGGMSM